MAGITEAGEQRAWEVLESMKTGDVCKAAGVTYSDATGSYTVHSFGMHFPVAVRKRTITSADPGSAVLLERLGDFFRLSCLWYLTSAKDIPCSERLIKLQYVKGGEIFTTGSHILPLEKLAQKYGANTEGFVEKAGSLGGSPMSVGDAAMRLHPFPRIPVVIALWRADEEFPARTDLLLDSTCELQIPTDIIWSVAMMSVLVML